MTYKAERFAPDPNKPNTESYNIFDLSLSLDLRRIGENVDKFEATWVSAIDNKFQAITFLLKSYFRLKDQYYINRPEQLGILVTDNANRSRELSLAIHSGWGFKHFLKKVQLTAGFFDQDYTYAAIIAEHAQYFIFSSPDDIGDETKTGDFPTENGIYLGVISGFNISDEVVRLYRDTTLTSLAPNAKTIETNLQRELYRLLEPLPKLDIQ